MADNIPSIPGGGVPPGAKVQPKKETVRINLPPKPSAAPTIKLPTLPPGGPSASAGPGAMPPHAPPTAAAAPARTGAAPVAAAPAPGQRPPPRAAAPVAPTVSAFDKVLAIAAAVAALVALGSTIYCMTLFN
jgi:hypothetical protein